MIIEALGNIGGLGVLIWFVIRFSKHTLPNLAKTFDESLTATRNDFKDALAEQRTDFFKFLEDQRNHFDFQIAAERQKVKQITDFLKEHYGPPNNH